MTLFLHILGILLMILLGIIVLTVLTIALVPLRVELKRRVGEPPLKLRLSAGPFKIVRSFGGKKKKKPKREQKQKKPERKPKKQRRSAKKLHWENLNLEESLELAFDIMDDLMGSLTFERLHVTVIVHRDDAAETGKLLGNAMAFTGLIYPELERRFVLEDTKLTVDADFEAEHTIWGVDIKIMTRAGRYPRILLRRGKRLLNLWRKLTAEQPIEQTNEKEN